MTEPITTSPHNCGAVESGLAILPVVADRRADRPGHRLVTGPPPGRAPVLAGAPLLVRPERGGRRTAGRGDSPVRA